MSNFKILEICLKTADDLVIEAPINSKFIGVRVTGTFPYVLVLANTAATDRESVKLVTATVGEEFGSPIIGETPEYVGSFQLTQRVKNKEGKPEVVSQAFFVFALRGRKDASSPTTGSSIIL